jgi:uncharacterized protein
MKRRDFMKAAAALAATGLEGGRLAAAAGHEATGTVAPLLPRGPLGRSGIEVSRLALGGVIGMQLPHRPDHDPTAIADTALDLGITYFDTAPSYNNGQSETNFGLVLARRRKEVFLACKTDSRTYDGTLRSVERSLKRLRTDHLDLLQIHGVGPKEDPAAWEKPGGVLTALRKLRDEKVTRLIGLTGHDDAEILRKAIEMYEFDTLLTTLNPTSRRRPFRENLLPAANQKRMGVIAMKVMGGGNGCLAAGNPLEKVLRAYHDQTAHQADPQSLVRYAMSLPISVAVIGVASVAQLKENVRLVKEAQALTSAQRKQLEETMG